MPRLFKIFSCLILIFGGFNLTFCQVKIYSINEVDSLLQIEPKPIVLLLSTNWCSYCKVQKQLVQKNEAFKSKSIKFYYVELDAESSENISFNGKYFQSKNHKNKTQTHPFIFYLLGNQKPVYPTWLILNYKFEIIYQHKGFLKPKFLTEFIEAI